MNRKQSGRAGELKVIESIVCPNCGKQLILLPESNPLYDVQCSRCIFRAQIKSKNSPPQRKINGAGWAIMEKVLKSGFLVPPMFANFYWKGNRVIRFYPFIPQNNLKERMIKKGLRKDYKMFDYIRMDELPYSTPYSKLGE